MVKLLSFVFFVTVLKWNGHFSCAQGQLRSSLGFGQSLLGGISSGFGLNIGGQFGFNTQKRPEYNHNGQHLNRPQAHPEETIMVVEDQFNENNYGPPKPPPHHGHHPHRPQGPPPNHGRPGGYGPGYGNQGQYGQEYPNHYGNENFNNNKHPHHPNGPQRPGRPNQHHQGNDFNNGNQNPSNQNSGNYPGYNEGFNTNNNGRPNQQQEYYQNQPNQERPIINNSGSYNKPGYGNQNQFNPNNQENFNNANSYNAESNQGTQNPLNQNNQDYLNNINLVFGKNPNPGIDQGSQNTLPNNSNKPTEFPSTPFKPSDAHTTTEEPKEYIPTFGPLNSLDKKRETETKKPSAEDEDYDIDIRNKQ